MFVDRCRCLRTPKNHSSRGVFKTQRFNTFILVVGTSRQSTTSPGMQTRSRHFKQLRSDAPFSKTNSLFSWQISEVVCRPNSTRQRAANCILSRKRRSSSRKHKFSDKKGRRVLHGQSTVCLRQSMWRCLRGAGLFWAQKPGIQTTRSNSPHKVPRSAQCPILDNQTPLHGKAHVYLMAHVLLLCCLHRTTLRTLLLLGNTQANISA